VKADAAALQRLGELLRERGYCYVTVTPDTHRRVLERARRDGQLWAKDLRGVFGWSQPFQRGLLPDTMLACLEAGGALESLAEGFRSRVRYSSLADALYVHSAFPTTDVDSVFFGPDTYRYANLLERWAPSAQRAVDVGCGSGAGGLSIISRVQSLVLSDLDQRALRYAAVNAELAGKKVELVQSDVLAAVSGELDLIVSNPPYMSDAAGRKYRDGGQDHGTQLSLRIVQEGLARLRPGGTLILYTGAPVVDGVDVLERALQPLLASLRADIQYEMLDPDVFGDELSQPAYADVERIAVVGLRVCLTG
jgi:SAM-dependent methyltransferase